MQLRPFRPVALFALTFLAISLASAQTVTTGQIAGTVADPSGAVIRDATLRLDSDAGIRRETVTGPDGGYVFNLLPPGKYTLRATAAGFQSTVVKDVEVRITETATIHIPLKIGSAAETVDVVSDAALVQTAAPVLGRVVDSRTLTELPLATRNYTQILGLSTGAATYLPDNTRSAATRRTSP